MENERESLFKQFINVLKSFTNSEPVNDGRVSVDDLSKDDRKELARVLKASGSNVKKIEDAMGINKYKATVDTDKAKQVAADKNKQKVVIGKEDKTRDNN